MHKMKKLICKILTFGCHWWKFSRTTKYKVIHINCRICGRIPGNQWEIYKKKFKGKKSGQIKTETKHVFRKRRRR